METNPGDLRPSQARAGGLPIFDPWAEIKVIAGEVWRDVRTNPKRYVATAVVAGAFGFLINFLILAFRYDGYRTPGGAGVTGQGSMLSGTVVWFLFPMLLSMIFGLVRRRGFTAMVTRVKGGPDTIKAMFALDGRLATSHLLFGFGGAAVVGSLMSPAVALVSGMWIIVLLLLPWRRLLVGVANVIWEWILHRLSIKRIGPRNVSVMVALVGASLGLGVSFVVRDVAFRLLMGAAAWVGGVVIARREQGQDLSSAAIAGATVLLAGAAVVLLDVGTAFADDGGWAECGRPGFLGYVTNCGGSPRVMAQSVIGGVIAFVGSMVGSSASSQGPDHDGPIPVYGSGCGPEPKSGGGSGPRDRKIGDHERAAEAHPDVQLYRSWRANNPHAPIDEYWDYHERVQSVRETNGQHTEPWLARKFKEFDDYMYDVGVELNKDWESGQMTDRVTKMPKHVVPALVNYVKDMAETFSKTPQQQVNEMVWQKTKELIGYIEVVNDARSLPPDQRQQVYQELLGDMQSNDPGYQMLNHLDNKWNELEQAALTGDNDKMAEIFTTAGVYLAADSALGHKMAGGTLPSATQGTLQLKSQEYFSRPALGAAPAGSQPRTKAEIVEQARNEGRPVKVRPDEYEQFGVESDVAAAVHQATIEGELRYVGFKDGDISQVEVRKTTPNYKYEDNKSKSYQPELDAPLQGKTVAETDHQRNLIAHFEPTHKPGPDAPQALHDRYELRMEEQTKYADQVSTIGEKGAIFIDENGNRTRVRMKPDEHGIFRDEHGIAAAGDVDTAYYMDGYQKKYQPDRIPDDMQAYLDSLPPAERTKLMDALHDGMDQSTIVGYLQRISKGKIQHEGNTWKWQPEKMDLPPKKIKNLLGSKQETLDVIRREGTFHLDKDGGTYCPVPATDMGRKFGEAPETLAGAGAAGTVRETSGGEEGGAPPGYDTQPGGSGSPGGPSGYDTQPGGSGSPGGPSGYDTQPGGSGSPGGPSGYDTQPGGSQSPGGPSGYDSGPTTGGGQ